MTTTKLLQRAETVRTRLRARLEALPDAEDAPTERQCTAIKEEALNGPSLEARLRNRLRHVKTPKASLDLKPLTAWRDLLTDAKEHFEQELATFETLSEKDQRQRYNEVHALRFALRVITLGPHNDEGESALLNEWLKKAGVHPEWGQLSPFSGRGGLRLVTRRISDVEKRLSDAAENLERSLAEAEVLLAKPAVTLAGRQAGRRATA